MEDSGKSFEANFKEWLNVADALMTEDLSGDSRRIITDQLAVLQKILQKKQREVETRLEEDIQKEDAEIARLQESLHGVGEGQAEQTEAYDMMPLWYNLKMVEWQQMYDALSTETSDTEKNVLARLISILQATYDRCREVVQQQHGDLEFAALFPGENANDREYKLPKRRDKDLEDHCTNCQVKTLQFCLPTIKQVLVQSIMEDKQFKKLFAVPSAKLRQAFEQYVEACIEFSWVACLEEEPVQLVTDPRKECKSLLSHFNGVKEVPNKSFVEWPAVVQNDVIRAAWQLFHNSKPRSEQLLEQQTEVVKQIQENFKKKEREKVTVPRAVVYEHGDEWASSAGSSIRSDSGSQLLSPSNSSYSSRRSSGYSLQSASYETAQSRMPYGKPTRVSGSAQNSVANGSAANLRQSAKAPVSSSHKQLTTPMSTARKSASITSGSLSGESVYERPIYEFQNSDSRKGGRRPAQLETLDF